MIIRLMNGLENFQLQQQQQESKDEPYFLYESDVLKFHSSFSALLQYTLYLLINKTPQTIDFSLASESFIVVLPRISAVPSH